MSAILGRIHFAGAPVDPRGIDQALAALAPYGRDGANAWVEGPVGLGHQHLAISPASAHEAQPLARDGLVIVADAILDNREALCERLAIDHGSRTRTPDSLLILLAYRRWGHECVSRLVGDFAFAIWDAGRQALFCARDHIGSRPLFFCHRDGRFLFSTDVRGLLAHRDLRFPIADERVASFLLRPFDCQETSFFQHIRHVAPGHWLHVNRHRLEQQAHWHPQHTPSIRYRRREAYRDHFRELLETAVADRLKTRFPVASHLSGGLDSTGVTILASRLLRADGRTLDSSYTWSPPVSERYPLADGPRDERRVIQAVCDAEGIACHYGSATAHDFRAYLARDIAVEGAADLFEELPVMAHAGTRGTRVMLSGWGGDESATFGTRGYPAYLLKRGQWPRLVAMARQAAGGLRHGKDMARFLWQQALLPLMPDALYARFSPYIRSDQLELLVHQDFARRFAQARRQGGPAWREAPDPLKVQAALLQHGHLGSRMATWATWSAPQGLVYRYPLTDRRLLDFTLGLPPELLWHQGATRVLYREALDDVLPRHLGKHDSANEQKRMDLRVACWRLLAAESRRGRFHRPCPWLDTRAMRERIDEAPQRLSADDLLRFIPLHSTLRVWHLWQRYGDPARENDDIDSTAIPT